MLNTYRAMWLFVLFDMPVETKKQRKNYSDFRKSLLKDGFTMMQYSVYVRNAGSWENLEAHIRRVKSGLPKEGHIVLLPITDKQFGRMEHFYGRMQVEAPESPQQLSMF